MNCPISGKPCSKYRGFYITEKHGDKLNTFQVCEDCLYLNASKSNVEIIQEESKCLTCGKTLGEIVKDSRVGCADCYDNFKHSMQYIISAVQATTESHKGKSPELWRRQQAEQSDPVSFATELSQKMKIAKRNEDYKAAAKFKSILDSFMVKLSEYHEADGERALVLRQELADLIFIYRESESAEGL